MCGLFLVTFFWLLCDKRSWIDVRTDLRIEFKLFICFFYLDFSFKKWDFYAGSLHELFLLCRHFFFWHEKNCCQIQFLPDAFTICGHILISTNKNICMNKTLSGLTGMHYFGFLPMHFFSLYTCCVGKTFSIWRCKARG